MKLKKVKLIIINQFPTSKPYIKKDDFFVDFIRDRFFIATEDYQNKKVLQSWQSIKFALVYPDDEDQVIVNHEELLQYNFRCEYLDEVLTEGGLISTEFRDFSFDIDNCETIIKIQGGICWLDEEKKVIHMQENQKPSNKKELLKKQIL